MDFNFSFNLDLGNGFFVLIGVAIAVFFFLRNRRGLADQVAKNAERAAQVGMGYAPPEPGQAGTEINEATHRFTGQDGDIAWTVEALALDDQDIGGRSSGIGNHQCYTRWSSAALPTGGGALIAMHVPDNQPAGVTPGSGWLGKLTHTLGGMALNLFVRTAFGATRSRSLSITPDQWLKDDDEHFAMGYRVFGQPNALMARLTPAARQWLLHAYDHKIAVLWDEKGIVLTWPTPRVKPEQVAACAEFGVAFVRLMRGEHLPDTTQEGAQNNAQNLQKN